MGENSDAKVRMDQSSILSSLLFIILLKARSLEFRFEQLRELLYIGDMLLVAESLQELKEYLSTGKMA